MFSILHSITVHSIDYLTLPIGLSLSLLWGLYAVAIVVCVVRQSPGTHRPLSPLIESIGRKVLQPKILPVFRRVTFLVVSTCPSLGGNWLLQAHHEAHPRGTGQKTLHCLMLLRLDWGRSSTTLKNSYNWLNR